MMRRLLSLMCLLLMQCLFSSAASACTMSLGTITANPSTVAVGATVTVTIPISYAQCKGGAIQLGDNAPAGLSYLGCSSSAEWDCNNVYTSGGATYSVYVPGNNGNKSATLSLSYTATSAGNRSITFTEYQTQSTSTVNIVVGGSPPSVSTNAATAISFNGATLNGSVSSNGASTTVSFEYGSSIAYGSSINATQSPLATGASGAAVSAALMGANGLTCGSTYHYRAKGVNASGTSYGSDQSFTTSACTVALDYHFDECSVNGTAGELQDSSGNNRHATAMQGAATANTAPTLLNRFGDLRDTDGRRYFGVVSPFALPSSWTLSAWVKFPLGSGGSLYHVLGAVSGGGDLLYLDGNFNLRWGVYTPGNIVPGTFQLGSLGAGWHHIAAVGSGSSTALYVDGAYKESVNSKVSGSLAYIGASYDVDAGTHEGMNAALDEVMLFSGALSASAIGNVYSNQLAGKNWDGTNRAASSCGPGSFGIAGTGSASTCTPQTLTISARDAGGNVLTGYTGTVKLSTSTNRGDWSAGSGPAPAGTLTPGAANSGQASYTFAAGDAGVVRLRLAHSLAQNLTVTVVDSTLAASASTSAQIQYRDNAFVWSEDLNNQIAGSHVVVAGRNHDLQVALWKKDAVSGNCAIASDYSGARDLKLWRSDNGGPWTAPGIVSPALASVPANRPAGNNLIGLNFNAGVAALAMSSSDIGKFSLSLDDDSLAFAANTISGNSGDLTLRPFALVISGIAMGAVNNPNGSAAGDAVFGKAGANFTATVGAYRWSAGADANGDGVPDGGASLAQVSAGGLAPSFNTALTLSPLAGSQTPATGVLGTLNNTSFSGFSGGSKTVANLQYTEVGSFQLTTASLVSNFMGSGQNLDALVFNSAGAQNKVVGRFSPANFALSQNALTLRSALACAPASAFNYLGENFEQALTLTARNALGATTLNYHDDFAHLDLTSSAVWQLTGIAGTTRFLSSGAPTRLSLVSSGHWNHGVASDLKLTIAALRASGGPDGPFENANALQLGIAPIDTDGVAMASLGLDTDSPADGVNDRSLIATVPLRFGRLRLQNAIGSQHRNLVMAMQAEYWNGSAFTTNNADSCTGISAAQLNFGNYRKSLIPADAILTNSPVQLASGRARLILAAPGGGRAGSYDLSLKLGSSDAACLAPWSPNPAAGSSAKLAFLQGGWCTAGGSYDKDPSARASFGLYGSSPNLIYQRENY